ncbi:unnamed protein product (macronuclear) [Paramecium tetraurelia]|uniref:THH1/TOM1/TOM3 domain-containing protein n=1 Tax=Paramecium tetraurelia TaxID=5888 RepID=A0E0Q1_PARTE|nr:uncharacterized protein GSPATT00022036001 [Paramecium tetraurelia]CAK88868.1 unnamed protein product [Paramecium tetraurelia]|eukprot:XP_001456265.1 hypothetical protein (macronuclear) [Paramecium tetraurelia strain d4-2]
MGALYKCQTNYQCSESLIDLIISSGILYYFIMKAKLMFERNNGILLLIDQALCAMSIFQMMLQVLYFMFAKSSIWLISLRSIGLVLELLICIILISVILEKEKHEQLFNAGRLGLFLIGLECVYYCGKTTSYQCNEISNLFMSFIGLMLSIVAFVFGFQCVHQLHQYKEYLLDNKNDSFAHQLLKLETRIIQIKILKLSGLVQFGVQFCWDSLAYFLSSTTIECTRYFIPTTMLTVLIYSLLKLISLITLPVAVFLVCYECNKEYFGINHNIWNFSRSHRSLKVLPDHEQLNYVEMSEIK